MAKPKAQLVDTTKDFKESKSSIDREMEIGKTNYFACARDTEVKA